jgi:hypothetical protein
MLEKKYVRAGLWLLFAASMHPLMWVFPFSFCGLWIALERLGEWLGPAGPGAKTSGAMAGLVLALPLAQQTSAAYHEAAKLHGFHYIQRWAWYELLGIVAPLALLWWFVRIARARQWLLLAQACRAFAIYGFIYLVLALVVDLPARFESLARIQPLRSLHLEYMFLFVCFGGFLGEYVLKDRTWRWLVLFVPMSIGMFAAQRSLFPANAHLEWPGRTPKNPWAQAFVWIRENTAVDALFALDPEYMRIAGENETGFRCMAQRSRLADANKDNGVVSMFPPLAEKWWEQVRAQTPWKNLQAADFARLKQKDGVSWIVLQQPGVTGIDCAYQNAALRVCRLP